MDPFLEANGDDLPRDYIEFPHLKLGEHLPDGTLALNRYSTYITRGHDYPPAKAMLYAAGVKDELTMQTSPQVGVASVWWEGNPCNMHLLDLGKKIKSSIEQQNFLAWQYNTIGVSDGITMGHDGMRFSLQSREIIADSIETVTCAQVHDACIAVPGCDKNMPGVLMGIIRHNRPSIVVYGGTQRGGWSKTLGIPIDMNTPSEARGAFASGTLQNWEQNSCYTAEQIMNDIEQNAAPGAGACGGMYTANSLAIITEALGFSLPGSCSTPASSPAKMRECSRIGEAIKICLEKDIRPRQLLTKRAFENALTLIMALGCSTNSVLHTLAIARTADVELNLEDFHHASQKTPVLADMVPSGKYTMEDLYNIGGVPSVLKLLIAARMVHGDIMTVTGKTMADNVAGWPSLAQDQLVIRPVNSPLKPRGNIQILYGNLAPGGAVAKISGNAFFTGEARVFNKEAELCNALDAGMIPKDQNIVLVVRYEGPKGGPGMPEQLRASGTLIGGGYKNVALITDGRYSGASHGFIIGHVVPEAFAGGPIAVVRDGDTICIDSKSRRVDVTNVTTDELNERLVNWKPRRLPIRRGTIAKYARLVSNASEGAVTDLF
ncbi:putative mitochondrial dihydroxy acid dehydratase [Pyrenochaeta sp. MPI-SDFR-AT-0127]|nr:putative mitochondrial dihydroxy acid dehydratase [Pyrenochaeta sp. MPI-SDFR-AT-0127]